MDIAGTTQGMSMIILYLYRHHNDQDWETDGSLSRGGDANLVPITFEPSDLKIADSSDEFDYEDQSVPSEEQIEFTEVSRVFNTENMSSADKQKPKNKSINPSRSPKNSMKYEKPNSCHNFETGIFIDLTIKVQMTIKMIILTKQREDTLDIQLMDEVMKMKTIKSPSQIKLCLITCILTQKAIMSYPIMAMDQLEKQPQTIEQIKRTTPIIVRSLFNNLLYRHGST